MRVHGNYMTWGCGEYKRTTNTFSLRGETYRLLLSLLSVLGIDQDVTVQGFDRNLFLLMHAEIFVASR